MQRNHIVRLLAGIMLINLASSVRADVLDNWTTNQITTNSFGFHHVVLAMVFMLPLVRLVIAADFIPRRMACIGRCNIQNQIPGGGVTLNYSPDILLRWHLDPVSTQRMFLWMGQTGQHPFSP
jgi:hypothetical protein